MRLAPGITQVGGWTPGGGTSSALVDVLLVGGGGGGAELTVGDGAQGTVVPNMPLPIGSYTVVVGAGGNVGIGGSSTFNGQTALGGDRFGNVYSPTVNNYRTGSNVTYGTDGINDQSETPGTANTGNGGSSSASGSGVFVDGGSGIVVIRYLTGTMTATGGIITTYGAYTVHSFLTGGTFQRTA